MAKLVPPCAYVSTNVTGLAPKTAVTHQNYS